MAEKKTFVTLEQLKEIDKTYPTPYHLYDEKGIRENAKKLKEAFSWNKGYREYFAIKATPNPYILKILKDYGCGVDCASMTELMMAYALDYKPEEIMFSSNDTPAEEYEYAAVKEKYGSKMIRPDYINAGMLLLNMKKIKETKLLEKARELIKRKKLLFADQDAIFWNTTKKKLLPRKYNEQASFNKKDTVICHFCKRLLWLPYPHTENYKQWNIEEIHKYLKCYTFDKDLEEYKKLKEQYIEQKTEKVLQ